MVISFVTIIHCSMYILCPELFQSIVIIREMAYNHFSSGFSEQACPASEQLVTIGR